jgi:hypothetical protein
MTVNKSEHSFLIPVMGTAHSADTPIRVAPFGISSVISLVDDLMLEQFRKHYAKKYDFPYEAIKRSELDGRAKRITAYLNMVHDIVELEMERIRKQPFFEDNDKSKYFDLLPDESQLKQKYKDLLTMKEGTERLKLEEELTAQMMPGCIDVNIMTKLDRIPWDTKGHPYEDKYSDARAALRGYALSKLNNSSIIFSAGMNLGLFDYMSNYADFYPANNKISKKIVIKISDFRSALIQGKILAKKGLGVSEFRIESGLNCGGHAFASNGTLLPVLLNEFKEKRGKLYETFIPLIRKFYESKGEDFPVYWENYQPLMTIQGGIGNNGEDQRLRKIYGAEKTGWGSPFLLVPEATPVDDKTLNVLIEGQEKDYFLSDASPLGIPFNNIHGSGAELWRLQRIQEGNPGSSCPKGFLKFNTEFTEKPICEASSEFLEKKLKQIEEMDVAGEKKNRMREKALARNCICHFLGNSSLIKLGEISEKGNPQSICPGPNLQWFKRTYSLKEMVDYIYGRSKNLISENRPHMFANEIKIYMDYFEKMVRESENDEKSIKALESFKKNLEESMDHCLQISRETPFEGENLDSIKTMVESQKIRLDSIFNEKFSMK